MGNDNSVGRDQPGKDRQERRIIIGGDGALGTGSAVGMVIKY